MVVSQSNTETVVSVTTRKSVFLNGETNYSCAVVYADGSVEESKPVKLAIRGDNIEQCIYMEFFITYKVQFNKLMKYITYKHIKTI